MVNFVFIEFFAFANGVKQPSEKVGAFAMRCFMRDMRDIADTGCIVLAKQLDFFPHDVLEFVGKSVFESVHVESVDAPQQEESTTPDGSISASPREFETGSAASERITNSAHSFVSRYAIAACTRDVRCKIP